MNNWSLGADASIGAMHRGYARRMMIQRVALGALKWVALTIWLLCMMGVAGEILRQVGRDGITCRVLFQPSHRSSMEEPNGRGI